MTENNPQLKIGIIGLGPVGATLAVHFLEAGAFVVACDIDPQKIDMIKKDGIVLKHTIEKHVQIEEVCYTLPELEMYDLDLVIIATKATALGKVVKQLSEIATEKMYVLCAQNGIDNEQKASSEFGEDKTLRMVINYAGNMSDRNTVHVSFFNPPNYVASMMPQGNHMAEKIAELLNSAGLETEIPEDIQDFVWEKAILNAALSAVCAITRRTMKDVMSFPKTLELVEAIIDESARVADVEGIELGKKFRRFCIQYLKNAGHHRPSMLVDLEDGRRTEIDFLNGKIVEYGRKHYLPTPLNQSVTALIHMLEYSPED
ncbi:MAG TPA: 2-dehydropantoate 2-reductase [Candidatus Marinimicrobia bacterium]|nr:2-dehydropantoate 2-reductase [Candidatus Neomarinimicrobiota bacterium]